VKVCYFWSADWAIPRAAMKQHAPEAEWVYTGDHDGQYWQELEKRWGGDDLAVIEHDITIHDQVMPQFAACREPFCSFAFGMFGNGSVLATDSIGCVRYTADAQRAVTVTDIKSCARTLTDDGLHIAWHYIEAPILDAFSAAGIGVHTHWPQVGHREK